VGLAATFDSRGTLDGFFVLAGGGMGMTHGDDSTFPRLADLLGWIPPAALLPVAEAIVGVHRDEGDRDNRKHARLKYVIARKGLPWFKAEVEARAGTTFEARELPPWRTSPVLGWLNRADGTLALGLSVRSGRIGGPLKAALKDVVSNFRPSVQLSPDQDLILLGLNPDDRGAVEALFLVHGQPLEAADPLAARAMACVALPLCGLALILGLWRKAASGLIAAMLLTFIVAISVNLARNNPIDCGCFDVKDAGKTREQRVDDMRFVIFRDLGMLLMVSQLWAGSRRLEREG
jgi:sulfite reductase beta subunit-like hemoprotein